MKERGSALLTAVIAIMVLLLVSGIIFTTGLSHIKVATSEEKGIVAYHMAEAGIQYGIAVILAQDPEKKNELPEHNPETINNPFGQGGIIDISWRISPEGDSFLISSTANYDDVIRKKEAEYLFEEDDDDDGDDGDDDDDDEEPVPGYPAWNPSVAYPGMTFITYDGRTFYNRYYANAGAIPGTKEKNGQYTPWQELTNEWRNFNVYDTGDVVIYNGHQYRAKWYSINKVPTSGDPWELIN
ncbi:MAG: carbohydrate-binding protein [Desulfitobacterium sp.]